MKNQEARPQPAPEPAACQRLLRRLPEDCQQWSPSSGVTLSKHVTQESGSNRNPEDMLQAHHTVSVNACHRLPHLVCSGAWHRLHTPSQGSGSGDLSRPCADRAVHSSQLTADPEHRGLQKPVAETTHLQLQGSHPENINKGTRRQQLAQRIPQHDSSPLRSQRELFQKYGQSET